MARIWGYARNNQIHLGQSVAKNYVTQQPRANRYLWFQA